LVEAGSGKGGLKLMGSDVSVGNCTHRPALNTGGEGYSASIDVIFKEHQHIIKSVMWRNRALITALKLEYEDVAQDLALAMFTAIPKFDPARSDSLGAHLRCKLQYELLTIKRQHKPHGITGLSSEKRLVFSFVDEPLPDGGSYELPVSDDTSGIEAWELCRDLSPEQAHALRLKLQGHYIKRKGPLVALCEVRQKYAALYP
jgi:DNA-directed RNA polymerase specialized sigma24 family protein